MTLRSKNLYISLIKDDQLRENTNSTLGQSIHGQWNVFGAKDLKEASFLTSFISDKRLSNLVHDTHAKTVTSNGTVIKRGISLSETDNQYVYGNMEGNLVGNQNGLVDEFGSLLNKIADNGTFATNACNLGSGDFGINTLKGLNNLTGNRGITFLLNMYKGSGNHRYPGQLQYGIDPGGSLSSSVDKSNGLVGYKGGKIFHINDVFINRATGTPIQLKK